MHKLVKIESLDILQNLLNERLEEFLDGDAGKPLREVFARWHDNGWKAFIFGGLLRDLAIYGSKAKPRDIDIVVSNKSLDELRKSLSKYIERETRFGGLHLHVANTKFDVWPLQSTWAFTHGPHFEATPRNLTRTTFLNVEGVVSDLPQKQRPSRIFEHGFLRGINKKELDINLKENPFPALAAIRTLITAMKLNYKMSPELREYILRVVDTEGYSSLMRAQKSHYGDVLIGSNDLVRMVDKLKIGPTK